MKPNNKAMFNTDKSSLFEDKLERWTIVLIDGSKIEVYDPESSFANWVKQHVRSEWSIMGPIVRLLAIDGDDPRVALVFKSDADAIQVMNTFMGSRVLNKDAVKIIRARRTDDLIALSMIYKRSALLKIWPSVDKDLESMFGRFLPEEYWRNK